MGLIPRLPKKEVLLLNSTAIIRSELLLMRIRQGKTVNNRALTTPRFQETRRSSSKHTYRLDENAAAMATIDSLAPESRKLPSQTALKSLVMFIPLTGIATNSSARSDSWTAR